LDVDLAETRLQASSVGQGIFFADNGKWMPPPNFREQKCRFYGAEFFMYANTCGLMGTTKKLLQFTHVSTINKR